MVPLFGTWQCSIAQQLWNRTEFPSHRHLLDTDSVRSIHLTR